MKMVKCASERPASGKTMTGKVITALTASLLFLSPANQVGQPHVKGEYVKMKQTVFPKMWTGIINNL